MISFLLMPSDLKAVLPLQKCSLSPEGLASHLLVIFWWSTSSGYMALSSVSFQGSLFPTCHSFMLIRILEVLSDFI